MIFRIFVKTDINSINLVGFKGEMHKKWGRWGVESEEWGIGKAEQSCAQVRSKRQHRA